jgi:ankyrin repeat protein
MAMATCRRTSLPARLSLALGLLLAAVCTAHAQVITTYSLKSVEVKVIEADRIVVGRISSINPSASAGDAQVSLTVEETLKGPRARSIEIAQPASYDLEDMLQRRARLLLFEYGAERRTAPQLIDLAEPHYGLLTADLRVLLEPDEILTAVRQAARRYPSNHPTDFYHAPVRQGRLVELSLYSWNGQLEVPVDARLERRARSALDSPRPQQRIWAARTLRHFRSQDHIRRLSALLDDPYYYELHNVESIERHYAVRDAALETLREWGAAPRDVVVLEQVERIPQPANAPPSPASDNPLHVAAANGNMGALVEALRTAPSLLDSVDGDDRTALHYAAAHSRRTIIEALVQRGAKLDGQTKFGVTPLQWSVEFAPPSVTADLLRLGANPELVRRTSPDLTRTGRVFEVATYTPLTFALTFGRFDHAWALIRGGANLNRMDEAHWTPLMYAVRSRAPHDLLREMIGRGADVNLRQPGRNGALHIAAMNADEPTMRLLLDAGASPRVWNADGKTPLDLLGRPLKR